MKLGAWLLAGVLGWAAPLHAGVDALPDGARLAAPDMVLPTAARSASDAAPALAALGRGDGEGAFAALKAIADPLRLESAAVVVIDHAQRQAPNAAADRLLAALAREPVRWYRRHDETAADWFLPLFDVPARAASARTLLQRIAARDRLLPALRKGSLEELSIAEAPVAAAALEALADSELPRVTAAMLAAPDAVPPAAWTIAARRSPQPELLQQALQRAPLAERYMLLQELPTRLAPKIALDWLEQAEREPAYRSTVIAAYGRLAPASPRAEAKLLHWLADAEAGPSAAAALARLDVPDRVSKIDTLLAQTQDPSRVARLALALRLEGSPKALQRLARLGEDPRLDAQTRQELQR